MMPLSKPFPRAQALVALVLLFALAVAVGAEAQAPTRQQILSTMKRATTFMVEKVSTNGGYVWSYLPDLSRRWGELEARDTMIWIQPPGTPVMGHLFLDAYHATGDEYYYQAAEKTAHALIYAQLPCGGWNYVADFAGDRSLREWYNTIGKNAWRLEEFQHYWGNATFDDAGTAESAKFLLRLYVEKHDPKYKPALDRALQFVLDSQYPVGAWPQRFPLQHEFAHHGLPDYTSFMTFNDDVANENIDFLLMYYQAIGDPKVLDPVRRGMYAFLVMQGGQPQPGWGLQYTPDYQPSGARTYEPKAFVTHTSATNLDRVIQFYRLTGDTRFLARVPEGIAWLESLTLPAGVAPAGRTHPTFIEVGTNTPLYVHREGSNIVNGRYFVDGNPRNTVGHYSSFRTVDVAGLKRRYEEAKQLSPADLQKQSPLAPGQGLKPLPRFAAAVEGGGRMPTVESLVSSLDERGAWITPLAYMSHPYKGEGPTTPAAGDFSQAHVGDEYDTSPFKDGKTPGISTDVYIRNMSVLLRAVDAMPAGAAGGAGK